jgi:hypothetical protein
VREERKRNKKKKEKNGRLKKWDGFSDCEMTDFDQETQDLD